MSHPYAENGPRFFSQTKLDAIYFVSIYINSPDWTADDIGAGNFLRTVFKIVSFSNFSTLA